MEIKSTGVAKSLQILVDPRQTSSLHNQVPAYVSWKLDP